MRFGLRSILAMGVLLEGAGAVPTGGGGGTPPAPPPPPPAPGGGQPFAVFESQAAFEERMARAQRSHLREQFGTENPDEVKQRLARLQELETAEAERKRAELSETQRLQADLQAAQAAREQAERALQDQRFETRVSGECAQLGVKNVKYALFLVNEARSALPEAQRGGFDPRTHLDGLLAKAEMKAALGIEAPPTVVTSAPVTTSPNPGQPPPAPPPPGGNPPAPVDANSMTPEQWRAHLASLGVSA